MLFEVGKYYKHTRGEKIHVVCEAELDIYVSPCFIAESNRGELIPLGTDEIATTNWTEITYEEWMNTEKQSCRKRKRTTRPKKEE